MSRRKELNILSMILSLLYTNIVLIYHLTHAAETVINDWRKMHSDYNQIKFLKVNAIFSKSLSTRIAKDLKNVHESPKIIWLDGELKVKFHASHYDINEEELNKHL